MSAANSNEVSSSSVGSTPTTILKCSIAELIAAALLSIIDSTLLVLSELRREFVLEEFTDSDELEGISLVRSSTGSPQRTASCSVWGWLGAN